MSSMSGEVYKDDFTKEKLESRVVNRGTWTFKDKQASCKWGEDVIKKIVRKDKTITKRSASICWNTNYQNGTLEFEILAEKNKSALIGFNGDGTGHIFFISMSSNGKSGITAWGKDLEPKQKHRDHVKEKLVVKDIPGTKSFKEGEWTKVKFTFQDDNVVISIGDHTARLKHPAFGRKKANTQFNFSEGSVRIRNFTITPSDK